MGLLATSLSYGAPSIKPIYSGSSIVAAAKVAIEDQRSNITEVPGEGSVLGGWVFGGNVYAFINKSCGASAGMHKSTSTGWLEVDLGTALNFDGTTTNGEFVVGSVITGAAGATGRSCIRSRTLLLLLQEPQNAPCYLLQASAFFFSISFFHENQRYIVDNVFSPNK